MPFPADAVKRHLRAFDLPKLFNQLGWDKPGPALTVAAGGREYTLAAVAQKRGLQVFECVSPAGEPVPDHATRLRVERQVVRAAQEHLLVFTDAARTRQVWQWVKREAGRPPRARSVFFQTGDTGERLAQKLQHLHVGLDEEDDLTLVDVAERRRRALDVEKVTKRFYDRFQTEHAAFLGFVAGIAAVTDRAWYASLMLNRLMFVYFIQKKRFLAGDPDYLRNKLAAVRKVKGGEFHTFYRLFLLRLFHEGLGRKKADRGAELAALIGDVPYLNGGLFDVHELEAANPAITVPDEAFDRLFAFFDEYDWHLDDRPARKENEINPDVLGYIFEKYINQKQMGAYYTKEDITGYIARNTILPFVLARAAGRCAVAFRPDGPVWRLLRDDPDRYIFPAVRHGADLPLPADIAAGVTDVAQRGGWNKAAPEAFALPTETWREHVARRQRCLDLRADLAAGRVTAVNDLVTRNLDLARFAADVVECCEGSDLLAALYEAVTTVSVLDPTCGSGAFLFAALNVLDPLYDAGLERMQVFVDEADRSADPAGKDRLKAFRLVLAEADKHPSRRYFILKSAVVNNLYGVDVMAEAVEICKLRLFLKLVAQIDRPDQIEPLPDIDFNVRAGNLHGICTERAMNLCAPNGMVSFIVQLPLTNSSRMVTVRQQLRDRSGVLWVIPFDDRPGKLFDGLQHCRSAIFISAVQDRGVPSVLATGYQRWPTESRECLFPKLAYVPHTEARLFPGLLAKVSSQLHERVLQKVAGTSGTINDLVAARKTKHFIFYQEATQYWVKATMGLPYYSKDGTVGAPAHGRYLYFADAQQAESVCAIMHSSLFYLYFITFGDCFHLSDGLVTKFPVPKGVEADKQLSALCRRLMTDLKENATRTTIRTKDGSTIRYDEYFASNSKPIIDEIDAALAAHYGFSVEELDFIRNYDIKYRLGAGDADDGE